MDNVAWVADATEMIYIRNLEIAPGLTMRAYSHRAGRSLRPCVGTTTRIGWNESPVCYHSFSEAKRDTCVHAVFLPSPISTTPGTETNPPRSGALKRENVVRQSPFTWECLPRILCFVLILFLRLHPVGHQVRPDAVEDTTVPRHLVRFEHHPVPVPSVRE